MHITQASINDLEILGELFDGYRQFYQQASDIDVGKTFLRERVEKQ